jgi:hypothetical protein
MTYDTVLVLGETSVVVSPFDFDALGCAMRCHVQGGQSGHASANEHRGESLVNHGQ